MDDMKPVQEKDLGQKSFESALATSFRVLKWAMLVVVVAMLFSGIFVVGPGEKAVRVRFGKMVGVGADKELFSGVHLAWPYPIESYIKVSVDKVTSIEADGLMYRDSVNPQNPASAPESLHPVQDGYTLTGDMNIIHTKWTIKYQITDVVDYINYIKEIANAGELDVLLENMLYDSVIDVSGRFTIDDAWLERRSDFIDEVINELRGRLAIVPTGIAIVNLNLVEHRPPVQTLLAFFQAQNAKETSEEIKSYAASQATKLMNEIAGTESTAQQILAAIDAVEQAEKEEDADAVKSAREALRDRLNSASGQVSSILSEAKSYKNRILEGAKADSDKFEQLLVKFKENPDIFIDQIYRDSIAEVLESVEETWVVTGGPEEVRIYIGRDLELDKKKERKKQAEALKKRR
jgi:modulator of FtsH protease HflK